MKRAGYVIHCITWRYRQKIVWRKCVWWEDDIKMKFMCLNYEDVYRTRLAGERFTGGHYWTQLWNFGFQKVGEISFLSEWISRKTPTMKLDKDKLRWADPPFSGFQENAFCWSGPYLITACWSFVQTRGTGSAVNILIEQKKAMKSRLRITATRQHVRTCATFQLPPDRHITMLPSAAVGQVYCHNEVGC